MTLVGVTTMHVFNAEYITARGLVTYNLKPSRNGWNTSVTMWTDKKSAMERSMTFLQLVQAKCSFLHSEFDDWSVEDGPVRLMRDGIVYTEKMLFGRFAGTWMVFAKVETAYGPKSSMRTWEANERREWLGWTD